MAAGALPRAFRNIFWEFLKEKAKLLIVLIQSPSLLPIFIHKCFPHQVHITMKWHEKTASVSRFLQDPNLYVSNLPSLSFKKWTEKGVFFCYFIFAATNVKGWHSFTKHHSNFSQTDPGRNWTNQSLQFRRFLYDLIRVDRKQICVSQGHQEQRILTPCGSFCAV